ncbi:MAG: MFS transporter [Minwuia sp.]|uniref:MFS transporter n=1 Tax=Minwuia sp. TaxID=2493630 RepID=UPI003A877E13
MTDAAALTPGERRAGIVVATACVASAALAFGLTLPLLGLLLEQDGWSRTAIGISSAAAPLAILFASPFVPRLVARFGARRVILTAAIGDAVLMLMLKVTDNYYLWLPIRLAMGVAVSALFVASESWINEVTENHNRGRVMAIYNIMLSAGFATGPLILLAVGTEGWAPFLASAAVLLVAAMPMALTPVVTPDFEGTPSFSVLRYFLVAPTLAGAMLMFAMVENGSTSLLAVYGARAGLPEPAAVTLISAVVFGGMVMAFPVGWLADRMDRIRLMLILAFLATVMTVLIPLTLHMPVVRLAVLFCWGASASSIYTVAMALQGERFRGADLVTANAAFGTIYGLGALAGPLFIGVSMDYDDPHGFAWAVIFISASFLIFTAIRQRMKKG